MTSPIYRGDRWYIRGYPLTQYAFSSKADANTALTLMREVRRQARAEVIDKVTEAIT